MELRQLEYYVAVVQHGSILQAASALNLSQPPLSVATVSYTHLDVYKRQAFNDFFQRSWFSKSAFN